MQAIREAIDDQIRRWRADAEATANPAALHVASLATTVLEQLSEKLDAIAEVERPRDWPSPDALANAMWKALGRARPGPEPSLVMRFDLLTMARAALHRVPKPLELPTFEAVRAGMETALRGTRDPGMIARAAFNLFGVDAGADRLCTWSGARCPKGTDCPCRVHGEAAGRAAGEAGVRGWRVCDARARLQIEPFFCRLPTGHAGAHQEVIGGRVLHVWGEPPEPTEEELRVGLDLGDREGGGAALVLDFARRAIALDRAKRASAAA